MFSMENMSLIKNINSFRYAGTFVIVHNKFHFFFEIVQKISTSSGNYFIRIDYSDGNADYGIGLLFSVFTIYIHIPHYQTDN